MTTENNQENHQQSKMLFNKEVFLSAKETDTHFILTLSDGRERKLPRAICGARIPLADYETLIVNGKDTGPYDMTKKDGAPFKAYLKWKFTPSAADLQKSFAFPHGGTHILLAYDIIPAADPNTREDVLNHRFAWRFPSAENTTLNKRLFNVDLLFDDACKIMKKDGPGLTRSDWTGRKKAPFTATIKWDFTYNKVKLDFSSVPAPGAPTTAPDDDNIAENLC